MIVIADTSPILNLARIGRLEILASLYRDVLIPYAVYSELRASKRDLPPSVDFGSFPWLKVAMARDENRVRELREKLDLGEAEAMVLAVERKADLLLIDERRGRRVATESGIAITGLLGVLAEAKTARLIPLVKPVLDELIEVARFWIGPDLYREVLRELNEDSTMKR